MMTLAVLSYLTVAVGVVGAIWSLCGGAQMSYRDTERDGPDRTDFGFGVSIRDGSLRLFLTRNRTLGYFEGQTRFPSSLSRLYLQFKPESRWRFIGADSARIKEANWLHFKIDFNDLSNDNTTLIYTGFEGVIRIPVLGLVVVGSLGVWLQVNCIL